MTTSLRNAVAYALTIPPHTASLRSAVAYALVRDPGVPPAPTYKPSDLRKAQEQLLYDLIEDSNPGFQAEFPLSKIQFGTPANKAIDPADLYKRDTTVVVSAKANSGILGSKTVAYRRIDMTNTFRGITAQINTYAPAGTGSLPKATWVAAVNAKYGLATIETDWQSINGLPENTVYTISTIGLCYKGSIPIQWVRGKRPMLDAIPDAKQVLVGRTYPAGNDFTTPGRKPVGEFELYGIDASEIKVTLESLAASTVMTAGLTTGPIVTILNWLKTNSGRDYFNSSDSTVQGGLGGLTWYKYTLPHASVPEANSARFSRVIVIQGVAGSWFSGKILLHYNP